jgi:hypothetical protein
MPISQVIANKMGQDFNVQPVPTESTGSETMTSQETLRNNFMAIARSCATEFLKQRGTPPNQPEATTDNSAPANVEDKDKNETIINNLQQALFTTQRALLDIAQHSTDPEVAQFAARVLDGNTLPSPPPEPLPPGMIPCAVCHKGVIPGQMHTC